MDSILNFSVQTTSRRARRKKMMIVGERGQIELEESNHIIDRFFNRIIPRVV